MNLILGRKGTGKSRIIYNQIKKCIEKGEDGLILIVPEQFTFQAERELIEVLDSPGILDVEVLSFSRLMSRLMEEVGGATKVKLSSTGKHMALQKSLLDRQEELSIYRGMVRKSGFIHEVQDMIANLKKKMICEEDLKEILENDLQGHQMLSRKLKDITTLMESYNHWLGEEYLDSEGVIDLLIDQMESSTTIPKLKIWVDGFDTFTEQMFKFIEKLYIYSKELTISLTQITNKEDRDVEIFLINENTQNKLMEIACGQAKLITTHYKQKDKPKDIEHLERELYSYPLIPYEEKGENIKIRAFKNVYEELDYLCIDILKLVQEEGYRFRDITVVTNDLGGYEFLVKRSFEEYNIPFFMDAKRKITDKPLSILLIYSLRAIAYHFTYDDMFALIKTGLTNLDYEEYEILENYVLKYGVKGGKWKKEFTQIQESDEFDLEKLNSMRSSIIDPLLNLHQKIKQNPSFENITIALYEYMESLSIEEKLQKMLQEIKNEYGQYEYAAEIAQIYNIVMDLFDEVIEIFGDHKTSIREYLDILESGIECVDLSVIPSSLDQVIVGDIMRTRTTDFKALFILGVNEGKLPSPQSSEGIFSENENAILREKGMEIEEDIGFKSIQERYLIYSALAKPKEKIIVSYPLADWEGSSLRPSVLIHRLQEIFPFIKVEREWQDAYSITNARGTIKHMVQHYRSIVDGFDEADESIWDDVYLWYEKNSHWENHMSHIKEAMVFDNRISQLRPDLVKGLYGEILNTSVTRLEEYSNCPFKHYVNYGLRPKERKIYQVSIPDIGEILHQLIYEYTLVIEKDGLDWKEIQKEKSISICREVMDRLVVDYRQGIFESNFRYKYLARYIYRIFLRAVETLTYHYKKGKFSMLGNELIFGLGQSIPPIKIELSQEHLLYLEGRIDRVDILKHEGKWFMKIMDFKTGNKELNLSDIYYGLSLQLIVYMWVCLNYGKKKDMESVAAGMFYFKLDDPLVLSGKVEEEVIKSEITKHFKLKGLMLKDIEVLKAMDEDVEHSDIVNYKVKKNGDFSATSKGLIEEKQLDQLLSHVENTITDIGEEIFAGNIAIRPTKGQKREACTYCNYKAICFFDQQLDGNKFSTKIDLSDEEVLKKLGGQH